MLYQKLFLTSSFNSGYARFTIVLVKEIFFDKKTFNIENLRLEEDLYCKKNNCKKNIDY